MNNHQVQIKDKLTEDDGLEIPMGSIEEHKGCWYLVPLPQCPDCGGDVVWYEAGYVPGTRKCLGKPISENDPDTYSKNGGCGSMFSVQTNDGHVFLRRERLYDGHNK